MVALLRELRAWLRDECEPPVYISDRRLVKAAELLRVAAATGAAIGDERAADGGGARAAPPVAGGGAVVNLVDCLLLQFVFWHEPDDIERVREWLARDRIAPSGLRANHAAIAREAGGDEWASLLRALSERLGAQLAADDLGARGGGGGDDAPLAWAAREVEALEGALARETAAAHRHAAALEAAPRPRVAPRRRRRRAPPARARRARAREPLDARLGGACARSRSRSSAAPTARRSARRSRSSTRPTPGVDGGGRRARHRGGA